MYTCLKKMIADKMCFISFYGDSRTAAMMSQCGNS